MTEMARRVRSDRQRWALPGGRHDKLVVFSRIALPVAVGVLAAFLVMAPLTSAGDVSFVLDKNKVAVAKERLRIQAARYRGEDQKGQPFTLTAGSAVQKSSAEPIVQLTDLAASLKLPDGPASITAPYGRYDMDSQQVAVAGPIRVETTNGYRLDTNDATVDLKTRRLASTAAVAGTLPQGTFTADHLQADITERVVRLDGHARLRIVPKRAR